MKMKKRVIMTLSALFLMIAAAVVLLVVNVNATRSSITCGSAATVSRAKIFPVTAGSSSRKPIPWCSTASV